MSFLFGKKDKKPGTRDVGPAGASPVALREKEKVSAPPPQMTPGSSVNNSLNSLGPGDQARMRPIQEQQFAARPGTSSGQGSAPNAELYPWSQRQLLFTLSQPGPFPRYGAAVNAVASKEGDIYVMGGLVNGQTVKGDLWMVESGAGNLACYPVRTEAEGPGPRVGHASLLVGNAYIVFGGDTKQDENDPLDDTLYLLNTSTKQWSRALPPGPRPAGRYGHTMNIIGSKLYVFGGQVDGHFFNDLLSFDLNQLQSPTNRWEMLILDSADDPSQDRSVPLGRTNHTMISWNERLYLFGGTDGMQWFNDVWTYDPRVNAWAQLDCIGYIPQPREGHSAALVNDVMYIFGGRTQEGDDLGDLAAFRITSRRWYTFQNMGPSPSPRSGHSMTAYDKQIVVLAGEPSAAQRDPEELSLVYILDTAKIRYPNDQQIQQTPTGERVAGNRRPSQDRNTRGAMVPREAVTGGAPPPGSRLPRAASASQGPPAPSQQQGPAPRPNVSAIPQPPAPAPAPRSRTPTRDQRSYGGTPDVSRGPSFERHEPRVDAGLVASLNESSRPPASRSLSPTNNTGQPQLQPQSPMASNNYGDDQVSGSLNGAIKTQPPNRQVQPAELYHSQEASVPNQPETFLAKDDLTTESSALPNEQYEAVAKEVEELKKTNATYLTELSSARKAGFVPDTNRRPSHDEFEPSLGESNVRVPEHFGRLRTAFSGTQSPQPPRLESLVRKISETEQQRDAAIKDAANAKAKLAAHLESPSASPNLGAHEIDEHGQSSSTSRKLAAALALQSDLQAKFTALEAQHATEKKAREVAESNAEVAHKRAMELDQASNPAEVESLRAELYELQREARDNSSQLNDFQAQARMLEIDNEDLQQQLSDHTTRSADHSSMLVSLREAVASSDEKYASLDRKLQQEREDKENVQMKLSQLRTEHEERTSELESTSRKLRDAEELAESHATEAQKHRAAILAGLDKLNAKPIDNQQTAAHERKITTLQQQVKDSNSLIMKSQAEADRVSEKLRSAEERIAGLEAYQQQSSREELTIRKQLQDAIRAAQTFQAQYAEAKQKLEFHQRDANALGVQHGALKDIVEERSASATRSLDSPSGAHDTLDTGRLRELEQMLEDSRKAHEETKTTFEKSQQSSDFAFREKIEQLEQDYQSAVSYVKGTEKMLKRMKDELTKSKTYNGRLEADLKKARSGNGGENAPADWENERQGLQRELENMQETLKTSMLDLERQLTDVQHERDEFRGRNDQMNMLIQQTDADLEKLKGDNAALEARCNDAEGKVTMLLDQMEHSVDHYRRQSQMHMNGNTPHHTREASASTYNGGHSHTDSIDNESFSTTGLDRNSMALDNLASELETLRTQWEGTHRTYRLSNNFDFDREPNGSGGELSNSLATWRKRLDAEERDREKPGEASISALRTGAGRGVSEA